MGSIEKSNSVVPGNVVRIINNRGLKQSAVAEKAGYGKQTFNAMMNGRKIIKVSDLIAIAKALNATPNDLLAQHPLDRPET